MTTPGAPPRTPGYFEKDEQAGGRAVLGVEHSATGRRWVGPDPARERLAEALALTGLSLPLARVLAGRGVAPEAAAGFLEPRLKDLLPDPLSLRDMARAAERLVQAALRAERIAIFADYDVDGGASAALLIDWLRALGQGATLYIPDRIDEGYGPNAPAMAGLAAAHDLILCVDCGTLSHEAIAAAAGCDVIVLDHHQGGGTLPPALAVVNPNRQDETGDLGHLCAAGVVFLTLVAANRLLKGARQVPDLIPLLDLVALATVADVAPLTGVNRAFVRQGLTVMGWRRRPGLVALADVARLDRAPSAWHLGFLIGPRVNAGGRIGEADLGARCLSTTDPAEARRLADRLDRLNTERREIEARVRDEALAQVAARPPGLLAWAAGAGWHPGVVGIVAARVKEATGLPAVVIGIDGGIGKGSARSVPGLDLGAAIHRLADEGLILKGGGHRMAAGLTAAEAMIPAAMARLAELVARQDLGPATDLPLDGLMSPGAATPDLLAELDRAGPFGAGAPSPRFAFADLVLRDLREVGTGHLRLLISDGAGSALEGIAFGAKDRPLGRALMAARGGRLHLAGTLDLDQFQGRRRVQLRVEDAALI